MFTIDPLQLRGRFIRSEQQFNIAIIDQVNSLWNQTGKGEIQ